MNKRILWIITGKCLLENIAIWIRNMAILYFIMEQTKNDPTAVSMIQVSEYLPIFLIAFIGGTLADRWRPKRTMIISDCLSAASMILIIGLLDFGFWPAIYLATLLSAIFSQFTQPSAVVMLKQHLTDQELSQAISLIQGLTPIFVIIGPFIGTGIYGWLGIEASLYFFGGAFLFSAFLVSFLPSSKKDVSQTSSVWQDMKQGFLYLKQQQTLKTLTIMDFFIAIGLGIIQPLEVFIITQRLELAKESLQWFLMIGGIGSLIGAIITSHLLTRLKIKPTMSICLGVLSLCVFLEALSTWIPITASIRFIVGLTSTFLIVTLNTLVLQIVDKDYVGRVSGIMNPIFTGGTLIGIAIFSPLFKGTSIIVTAGIASLVILVSVLYSLRVHIPEKNQAVPPASISR
ncbi:MFS transporter [Thermoflavimicrobium daqui]|nr:MFS transporter [Thermoflavimicrobium daqui]